MNTKHLTTGSVEPALVPGKIRVYAMRFCPYTQRVLMQLEYKQIPHDVVYINLKNKPEWFVRKSPRGTTPAIEMKNGETLFDSMVIGDYIDETHPEWRMYPVDPFMKAHDKIWINHMSTIMADIDKLYHEDDIVLFEKVLTHVDEFDSELKKRGTTFFAGDQPGMMDFFFWPIYERLNVLKIIRGDRYTIPEERFPNLFQWGIVMKEESVVEMTFLEPDVHAKFIKSKLAGTPDFDFLHM